MKRKKTLESDAMKNRNKFSHPAKTTNSTSKQHQLQQHSNTQSSSSSTLSSTGTWQVYTNSYSLVRRAAAYSMIIFYLVQVLCCETAHGVHVTKRETTIVLITEQQQQQQRRRQHYVCI